MRRPGFVARSRRDGALRGLDNSLRSNGIWRLANVTEAGCSNKWHVVPGRLCLGLHMHQRRKGPPKLAFPRFKCPVLVKQSLKETCMLERGAVSSYVAVQPKWKLVAPKNITGITGHTEFDNDEIADAHDESIVVGWPSAVQI